MSEDRKAGIFFPPLNRAPEPPAESTFTFQYVSINTKWIKKIYKILVDFTFQYVSINTGLSEHLNVAQNNLHSNMFLLIQVQEWLEQKVDSKFTFQYVSINTEDTVDTLTMEINLHSNMFLLIQRRSRC